MLTQIRMANLPEPDHEFPFHAFRQWRFDFAWLDRMIALEVEGLHSLRNGKREYGRSRHLTPKGFEEDCEKYNAAAILGWTVLRVTTTMVRDGRALTTIEEALKGA